MSSRRRTLPFNLYALIVKGEDSETASNAHPTRFRTGAALIGFGLNDLPTVEANSIYFNLGTGNFIQNWSDVGMITTNDDWNGVPSIIGFLGDGIASTGVDPQTVTGVTPIASQSWRLRVSIQWKAV